MNKYLAAMASDNKRLTFYYLAQAECFTHGEHESPQHRKSLTDQDINYSTVDLSLKAIYIVAEPALGILKCSNSDDYWAFEVSINGSNTNDAIKSSDE